MKYALLKVACSIVATIALSYLLFQAGEYYVIAVSKMGPPDWSILKKTTTRCEIMLGTLSLTMSAVGYLYASIRL